MESKFRGGTRMKKLLVLVPEADHERIRKLAFEQKTSMADIVRQAIKVYLKEERITNDN